mgnify:CR=1 FL=1
MTANQQAVRQFKSVINFALNRWIEKMILDSVFLGRHI